MKTKEKILAVLVVAAMAALWFGVVYANRKPEPQTDPDEIVDSGPIYPW